LRIVAGVAGLDQESSIVLGSQTSTVRDRLVDMAPSGLGARGSLVYADVKRKQIPHSFNDVLLDSVPLGGTGRVAQTFYVNGGIDDEHR